MADSISKIEMADLSRSTTNPITDVPPPYIPPQPSHYPDQTVISHAPVISNAGVVGTNVGVVGVNVGHDTTAIPVVIAHQVSPKPMVMTCRSCNMEITTKVEKKSSMKTHLLAALLCALGCWCCVCIPYCKDSCRNSNHYCPNCNAYIGSYSP